MAFYLFEKILKPSSLFLTKPLNPCGLVLQSFYFHKVSLVLLSMEGPKALRFHQKDLHLCSEDEQKSYRLGTTLGRVIDYRF